MIDAFKALDLDPRQEYKVRYWPLSLVCEARWECSGDGSQRPMAGGFDGDSRSLY